MPWLLHWLQLDLLVLCTASGYGCSPIPRPSSALAPSNNYRECSNNGNDERNSDSNQIVWGVSVGEGEEEDGVCDDVVDDDDELLEVEKLGGDVVGGGLADDGGGVTSIAHDVRAIQNFTIWTPRN
ncbi:uncharacterized protein LACBIDRAFT_321046 [Laccaria bicolor S238N-H82]|uniref:Predicted protein n=1 Tax=Laccaria bicolor (strain S238N-H82 / ATCC MYA-4686) TaxID=486041 RepID=B0CNL0_LACBS|nr:uncharacterized protein LACBIDRAFT_321046 [Laccaria bicolor S238N-H82]EDR15944.1 predicted protein [Laccaria bicolor S238N-H82]|eukprot:XP_001874152.1 predicted protein [Laccaria bicolor S238N-H82]